MRVEIIYPRPQKRKEVFDGISKGVRWIFLFAAFICVVVNSVTGGKAWSAIVVWSIWTVWSTVFSPALVEYNRISWFIKLIADSCILLILIGALLSPGWAVEVVPIVCFSALAVTGVMFFTDIDRQKQNMLPMLLLIFVCIVCAAVGLAVWREESRWALAVMGAFAVALLTGCVCTLGRDFITELKKRFHTR